DYCLVGRYKIGGIDKELRSRIVPISYYDFVSKRTVRVLRVDFNDVVNSSAKCTGQLTVFDSSGSPVPDPKNISPVFDPALICPTCTSILSEASDDVLRIFQVKSSGLQEVAKTSLQISGIRLAIDPNNSSGASTGTCSLTECKARGYDCCLDNQC